MGFKFCFFGFLGCLLLVSETTMAQDMKRASIVIDGANRVAETDENFVCATLDWWPHDKCNYDNCPWGYSSVINMVITKLEKRIHLSVFSISIFIMFATAIEMFDLLNVFQDLTRPLLAKAVQGLHLADRKLLCHRLCVLDF